MQRPPLCVRFVEWYGGQLMLTQKRNNMKEALKLILEAMVYRVQQEKASEEKSIDSFVSHTKAKEIARERMIKAIEEL